MAKGKFTLVLNWSLLCEEVWWRAEEAPRICQYPCQMLLSIEVHVPAALSRKRSFRYVADRRQVRIERRRQEWPSLSVQNSGRPSRITNRAITWASDYTDINTYIRKYVPCRHAGQMYKYVHLTCSWFKLSLFKMFLGLSDLNSVTIQCAACVPRNVSYTLFL